MLQVNQNIPWRVLDIDFSFNYLEAIILEFFFKKEDAYRLIYIYPLIIMSKISKPLTKFSFQFDDIMLLRDFDQAVEIRNLDTIMSCFDLKSLIEAPTCF